MKLKGKQRRFVEEYMKDFNATQAAIRAGYSKKTARVKASQLLTKVNIEEAIEREHEALRERAHITQDRILEEEKHIALGDLKALFDKDGVLLPPHKLPETVSRAVAAIEVTKKVGGAVTYKYKLWDKGKALERMSRQLGLYKDKLKIGVGLDEILRALPGEFGDQVRKALGDLVSD